MSKKQETMEAAPAPRADAPTPVPCAVSRDAITAAFEAAIPPASPSPCPLLGAFASWRFNPSYAPAERLSLRSLRHRLHVRCHEILTAANHLQITPKWCHDHPTGQVIATVTLPEAEKIAEAILFPESGEAADHPQPSTENPQLRLKLPGRLYIVQLDPNEKPLRVKLGFTTNLEKRLRAFRCIAPDARYFAHWPAEDFWERTATASITLNCRHLGGEVYEAQSLEELQTRAKSFLALMPKPATSPRFIPVLPRPTPHLRFQETPPLLNPNLNHNPAPPSPPTLDPLPPRPISVAPAYLPACVEAALPALCGHQEDGRKVLGVPPPSSRRGQAAGGAEPGVAVPETIETRSAVCSLDQQPKPRPAPPAVEPLPTRHPIPTPYPTTTTLASTPPLTTPKPRPP